MAEKLGIENIKKAVRLGLRVGKKTANILEDGVKPLEFLELIPEVSELPAVVTSAPMMKEELNDYSLEERTEVREIVRAEFPEADDDEVQELIENALDTAAAIYKLATSRIFKRKVAGN